MIKMQKGDDVRFVFDFAVEHYKSKGYAPVSKDAPKVAVRHEEPVEEAPKDEVAEVVDYEPDESGKYVCPYCGKDYSTKANLVKHIESKHPDKQ